MTSSVLLWAIVAWGMEPPAPTERSCTSEMLQQEALAASQAWSSVQPLPDLQTAEIQAIAEARGRVLQAMAPWVGAVPCVDGAGHELPPPEATQQATDWLRRAPSSALVDARLVARPDTVELHVAVDGHARPPISFVEAQGESTEARFVFRGMRVASDVPGVLHIDHPLAGEARITSDPDRSVTHVVVPLPFGGTTRVAHTDDGLVLIVGAKAANR